MAALCHDRMRRLVRHNLTLLPSSISRFRHSCPPCPSASRFRTPGASKGASLDMAGQYREGRTGRGNES
eukprot:765518-Hanusia_phi.AAC.4